MRKLLIGMVALGATACATPPGPSPTAVCLPCPTPCTPDSCKPPEKPATKVVAKVAFNPAGGSFTGPQSVSMSTTTPNATIHYTTNGRAPAEDSLVYTEPVPVDSTTTLRAVAIAPGMAPSPMTTGTYLIEQPPPPEPPPAPAPPARVSVTKERLQLTEKVRFDSGKTTIQPGSFPLLDDVAAAMKDHPEVKQVIIEGHTDSRGKPAVNKKLSKGRAEAVREYLVKKGVEPGRLEAKGYGASRPISDNKTAKGQEENRRVEFVIPAR